MLPRLFFSTLILSASVFADDRPQSASLLDRLASTNFQERREASAELRELPASALQKLALSATQQPSAEVAIRVLAEVENRYISLKANDSRAAAETLEKWRAGGDLLLAESAEQGFQLHWPQRVAMAAQELQRAGAVVKMGSFNQQNVWLQRRDRPVQIFLHEGWKGTDAHLDQFRHLAGGEETLGRMLVQVYLLDGHSVTEDQRASLGEIIGHSAIVERSRAALGIQGVGGFDDGVIVRTVTAGGSASVAGIEPGDLLLAIESDEEGEGFVRGDDDPNFGRNRIKLEGFEQLIQRLRRYEVNDVVTFRVERRGQLMGVKVKLKGWEALETQS